ncbi:hypothetical protein KM043_005640 [Ampulex compressa]|nr:hypothetical protein KM043_005640 [Ampulex compressa]
MIADSSFPNVICMIRDQGTRGELHASEIQKPRSIRGSPEIRYNSSKTHGIFHSSISPSRMNDQQFEFLVGILIHREPSTAMALLASISSYYWGISDVCIARTLDARMPDEYGGFVRAKWRNKDSAVLQSTT